jgi:hypothetical protein
MGSETVTQLYSSSAGPKTLMTACDAQVSGYLNNSGPGASAKTPQKDGAYASVAPYDRGVPFHLRIAVMSA